MFGLKLSDLDGRAITLPGMLVGVHAVLRPDANRVIAMIIVSDMQTYLMYVTQMDNGHIAIEFEREQALDPATGERARESHRRALNIKPKV